MRVWVAQCLCPARHCIIASAGEAESVGAATVVVLDALQEAVEAAMANGSLNPWCGICRAEAETWQYELARTRYRSMQEAMPHLREAEEQQAVIRRFGDSAGSA